MRPWGRCSDDRYSDERYSDGRYSDERYFDGPGSESSSSQPRPFAGDIGGCIAAWPGRKTPRLGPTFRPSAGCVRSKFLLPATEKWWRRKRMWTELVRPAT